MQEYWQDFKPDNDNIMIGLENKVEYLLFLAQKDPDKKNELYSEITINEIHSLTTIPIDVLNLSLSSHKSINELLNKTELHSIVNPSMFFNKDEYYTDNSYSTIKKTIEAYYTQNIQILNKLQETYRQPQTFQALTAFQMLTEYRFSTCEQTMINTNEIHDPQFFEISKYFMTELPDEINFKKFEFNQDDTVTVDELEKILRNAQHKPIYIYISGDWSNHILSNHVFTLLPSNEHPHATSDSKLKLIQSWKDKYTLPTWYYHSKNIQSGSKVVEFKPPASFDILAFDKSEKKMSFLHFFHTFLHSTKWTPPVTKYFRWMFNVEVDSDKIDTRPCQKCVILYRSD